MRHDLKLGFGSYRHIGVLLQIGDIAFFQFLIVQHITIS